MKYTKLQIKLLSKSGELLRCISCFAGQVSVFRAGNIGDLQAFQRTLAGIPGPERLAVSLDDKPFIPQEHNLIGFGERFLASKDARSTEEFLIQSGVPDTAIDSLLLSYGLENVKNLKCSELTQCEERRLRILTATYSTDKVLVINEPFEPISSQWRERFAELIVSYARTKEQVVIVPSLSYRPDSWIDNEYVARIQVGENRQKTIGFGSGVTNVNALVDRVRQMAQQGEFGGAAGQEHPQVQQPAPPAAESAGRSALSEWPDKEEAQRTKTSPSPAPKAFSASAAAASFMALAPVQFLKKKIVPQPVVAATLTVAFGMAIFLGVSTALRLTSKDPEQQLQGQGSQRTARLVRTPRTHARTSVGPTSGSQSSEAQLRPVLVQTPLLDIQPTAPQQTEAVRKDFVLDLYPPEIRKSVLESFENNLARVAVKTQPLQLKAPRVSADQTVKGGPQSPRQSSRSENAKTASDLLKVLASTSGSGDGLPDQGRYRSTSEPSPEEMAGMSPEQKREMIRQKFLEAIQRAAQQPQR